MSRRLAREELFKITFEAEVTEVMVDEVLASYLKRNDVELHKNDREFIEKYAKGMAENNIELKSVLTNNITGWTLDRVGNIEKALLKISTYEILHENIPEEIVVNEVVELAKKYGDEKSHEFINGVLAKIIVAKKHNNLGE